MVGINPIVLKLIKGNKSTNYQDHLLESQRANNLDFILVGKWKRDIICLNLCWSRPSDGRIRCPRYQIESVLANESIGIINLSNHGLQLGDDFIIIAILRDDEH